MKRPALLMRFPSLRAKPVSYPVIRPEAAQDHPALAEDIAVVNAVAGAAFVESDRNALTHQNRYRRMQVVVVLGAALLSGLGGLQAVFPDQRWPGVLLAVIGLALTAAARSAGELGTLNAFLTERIKAERLRAIQFRFLSRTGQYAGDDREILLRRAVLAIRAGEEPR